MTLAKAGISSHWNKLGRKSIETLAGQEVTLLDRLHKQWQVGSSLITKEITILDSPSPSESSIESTVNPPSVEMVISLVPSPTKKILKEEVGGGKPSSSSTRADLRNLTSKRKIGSEKIISLEGVMNCHNLIIDSPPPNQKRSICNTETKGKSSAKLDLRPPLSLLIQIPLWRC